MRRVNKIEYYKKEDKMIYISILYKYKGDYYIRRENNNFYILYIGAQKELKVNDVFFMDNKECKVLKLDY